MSSIFSCLANSGANFELGHKVAEYVGFSGNLEVNSV